MTDTSSSYSDSSYTYSYSTTTESNEENEMWNQIQRMPFAQLHKTDNFIYVDKVMNLVKRYEFSTDDPHMSDCKYTMHVAQLLKLITTKCDEEIKKMTLDASRTEKKRQLTIEELNIKLDVQHKEIIRLREFEEKTLLHNAPEVKEDLTLLTEFRRLKEGNDNLTIELRKVSRENEELRQFTQIRKDDREEVNEYNSKILLEFKHLVAKHNRLLEKSKITEDMLQELRSREEARCQSEESELARLREKVDSLQQENEKLVHSRDRAEELCEHREAQALRDMAELRQVTKRIIQAEAEKFDHLKVEFANYKSDNDTHLEEIINQHEAELADKEEEIKALQIQVGKTQRIFDDDSEMSSASVSASGSEVTKNTVGAASVQHRLQRENYDLSAEIEQLEIRLDAAHEENSRLARIVKDYESGNEGLRNLRHTLADSNRTNELLQTENTQLRERLHAMEDSLTFTAALQELCRRIGVTDEEINSLKPTSTQTYSEMDTLKDELNILKEEVEWLEKDRRHWMNKVRLQPLMDTKLRFELGLSSEQLKQLDSLVEQMKSGKLVLEDDDTDYKEKYFKELQLRRKDASQFNDYVKGRIDSALQHAIAGMERGEGSLNAISSFRDHVQVITTLSGDSVANNETVKQLREQLSSCARRIDQSEFMIKAEKQQVAKLNEELSVGRAEKEVIAKECERYRDLVFSYIANEGSSESNRVASEKWADIATALRDQVKLKDNLIETMLKKTNGLQDEVKRLENVEKTLQRETTVLTRTHQNLNDQLAALRESNDELIEHNAQLTKMNKDVVTGLEQSKDENSTCRELLQKIVVLRKREGALIQRLRRATAEKEEISASQHNLRTSMETTLQSLKEILQGSSNGVVLAPSATTFNAEQDVLGMLHESVVFLTKGKLYREDSSYLAKLYNVYCSIENSEKLMELRAKAKQQQNEINVLTEKLEEVTIELEVKNSQLSGHDSGDDLSNAKHDSLEYYKAASNKWETEAILWKQRHLLGTKRLEVKEQEVALLEAEVGATREEVVKVKSQIQNIFSQPVVRTDVLETPALSFLRTKEESPSETTNEKPQQGMPSAPPPPAVGVPHDAVVIHRLEKEVARLKSINFSLLQHSLDIQSSTKSLELELERKKQEISLIRSSSDGKVVSDFIAAAIHEHTLLRRKSELALIQTKKLKMKLAVTEANLQVVSNEATSYKLGAYRLYRKYVDEVVKVVDYLRSIQRASEGALSPHRAEILDKRYARVFRELESTQEKNSSLVSKAADLGSMVKTLEHQLDLVKEGMTDEAMEKVHRSLREAHSKTRESTRQLIEAQEDAKHSLSRISRMDEYIRNLTVELSRLEFGCIGASPLDETMIRNLLQLKETVFAATQAPPLALTVSCPTSKPDPAAEKDGVDPALLDEYKQAMKKQMELSKECNRLSQELERGQAERARQSTEMRELKETIKRLEDQIAYTERQLNDTRKSAETRETRLAKAHETQSSVVNRATEHTTRCLQELIQKKDAALQQLQGQLQTERQKLAEYQAQESVRMEKLHEEMSKDNKTLVTRFEEAISAAAPEQVEQPGDTEEGGSATVLTERVRALTAQVVALKQELALTKDTNISLEAQLEALIKQCSLTASAAPMSPVTPHAGIPTAAPKETPMDFATGNSMKSIIGTQQTMIDSLRTREISLLQELAMERQRREGVERELERLRLEAVERGATVSVTMPQYHSGTRAPLEEELRTQIARMEQDLVQTRQELEQEKKSAEQQRLDALKWKEHLNRVHTETEQQREELNKARHAASMNEEMQKNVASIQSQNEKLVLAASILKQRLMEEAQRGGAADRKLQQEVALAQRLGVIQEESVRQVKQLDHKIQLLQKDLDGRVAKENQVLQHAEETQRLVAALQQQLREKEKQVVDLQRQTTAKSSSPPPRRSRSASPEKRAPPALESGAMMQPQVASLISKELHKMQRDNLQEISTLRASQRRMASDLEESKLELRSERETSRLLRTQLHQLKKEKDENEERLAKEIVRLHREGKPTPTTSTIRKSPSKDGAATTAAASSPDSPATGLAETNQQLQQRVKELEGQLEKARDISTSVSGVTGASARPANMQQYMTSVQALEKVIDELQKKVNVDAATKVNTLEQQRIHQQRIIQQLASDLATAKGLSLDSVRDAYQITVTFEERPNANAESELLHKSNRLVEVEYECETLRTQVKRLQQHFQELLDSKGLAHNLVPASEVAVLHSLIENLKIVVESLRQENAALRGKVPSAASYTQNIQELRQAREREQVLHERLQEATNLLVTSSTQRGNPSADVLMQRNLSARDVEQLFQRTGDRGVHGSSPLPPPLPQNPYSRRTPRAGSQATASKSAAQRRLSGSQH